MQPLQEHGLKISLQLCRISNPRPSRKLAGIGLDGQDRMTLIVFVLHDCHQKRLTRETFSDEDLALEQRKVLAIAFAVGRVVPLIDNAPMLHVRYRFDMGIDPLVNPFDLLHRPRRQTDVERRERTAAAFSSITAAEIQPTMGHARRAA